MCSKILIDFLQGKVYMCVYCINVDLCEECYWVRESYYDIVGIFENGDIILFLVVGVNGKVGVIVERLVNDYVEVCFWGYMLVELFVKGWKGVCKDGVLEYGGGEIKFSDWLEGLKGWWERVWWWYWREVEQ